MVTVAKLKSIKSITEFHSNEHPIFGSGMDGGMTQGHLNLKHCTPNIKDAHFRRKRPTKDQVTSRQPQWDLNEHSIFCSRMDGGMTQGHLNLKHCTPKLKDAHFRRKRPTKDQVTSRQSQWDPN